MPEAKLKLGSPDSKASLLTVQDENPTPKSLACSCCGGSWEKRVTSSLADGPKPGSRKLEGMSLQANQSCPKVEKAAPL